MVGLLAGIDFSPSPSEFQALLDSGDLVEGLQYVTIELTRQEAGDEKYLTSMFQGAAVKQGWLQGVHAKLTIKKAKVNGKPVIIVYPSAAASTPVSSSAPHNTSTKKSVKPKKSASTGMPEEIKAEADTLEEARELIKSQVPEGFQLISERVVSKGRPKTVKATADTTEEAFAQAQAKIPRGVDVLEEKVIVASEHKTITIEAFDQQSAESSARVQAGQFDNTATVESVILAAAGRKGFLGIGKEPNQYVAEICRPGVVEITYKRKAKISARIGRKLTPEEKRQLIESIVTELESQDKDVRDAAIKKLEETDFAVLGDASELIVVPLVTAARWGHKYKDDASRTAVRVLVKIGKPAVQPLLELFECDNRGSIHIACIALAKMGDPAYARSARAKLGAHFKELDDWQAFDVIDAMVVIGDRYAVGFLMQVALKTHPNPRVRSSAATALGLIGHKRAIPALTEALQDPTSLPNVRRAAKWALQKLR